MENKELIQEVQRKIQFATTIAIFFGVALSRFYDVVDRASSDTIFLAVSGLVVVTYILIYIVFDFLKSHYSKESLKDLEYLVLGCIMTFVIPIYFFAFTGKDLSETTAAVLAVINNIALTILLALPIILFFFLFWKSVKDIRKLRRKK